MHNPEKWESYVVRPSDLIHSSKSPFYEENAEIVKKELEYLIETKPEGDVWGINWNWEKNTEKYQKEFPISENWWKSYRAIEFMRFLMAFCLPAKE